jgi:hypothetical protein
MLRESAMVPKYSYGTVIFRWTYDQEINHLRATGLAPKQLPAVQTLELVYSLLLRRSKSSSMYNYCIINRML